MCANSQAKGGPTTITTDIRGFYYEDDEFLHGIHVDTRGDVTDYCRHTGSHFNPLHKRHGEPLFGERLFIYTICAYHISIV